MLKESIANEHQSVKIVLDRYLNVLTMFILNLLYINEVCLTSPN